MDFDWKKHLRATLESTYYCALATSGPDGAWVNPVYFAYDDKFNLYFISMLSSRHMRNIGAGAPVAVAIYATNQPPGHDVNGIQLSGRAELMKDDDVPQACDIYYGRAGAAEAIGGKPNPHEHMGDDATWKFVKIVPTEVFYFDTRFFDEVKEGRQRVPIESFA